MGSAYTINELLVLEKKLKERRNQLAALSLESANIRKRFFGDQASETTTPTYSITDVEEVLFRVNMALLNIDQEIKRMNGVTNTNIAKSDIDLVALLQPIKARKSE